MIYLIIITIVVITPMFSASNYLHNEIEIRNKLFREVKINKGFMNLLYFGKKDRILNLCIFERILGYICIFASFISLVLIYINSLQNNEEFLFEIFKIIFYVGIFNTISIFILLIIGKIQQKYSYGDLKNFNKIVDIKEYNWNKYVPFSGDVSMFKEQGIKYLRAEERDRDKSKKEKFKLGGMFFSTTPPNELKRSLQNLNIKCK